MKRREFLQRLAGGAAGLAVATVVPPVLVADEEVVPITLAKCYSLDYEWSVIAVSEDEIRDCYITPAVQAWWDRVDEQLFGVLHAARSA